MKHLPIHRAGHIINWAKVDDDTFEKESVHKWYLQTRGTGGKAQITRYQKINGKTTNIFLARVIMGIDSSSPKQVYPIDGDTFNMQRDNLGVAAVRRRIQHRATVRKLGGSPKVPQLGIAPIVAMAGRIGVWIDERNGGYGSDN